MQTGVRVLWIVIGVVALVLLGAVAMATREQTAPGPLTPYIAHFDPEYHQALTILAQGQADLARLDPLDTPQARQRPAWQRSLAKQLEAFDAEDQDKAREAYKVRPRGFEPATELEISTLRHVADAMDAAGVTPEQLATLAHEAQSARMIRNYSVPGLLIRAAQPNYRAVIMGHVITNPKLAAQRSALATAPLDPDAPLDPLYPLAVNAARGPVGLAASLRQLSAETSFSWRHRIQIAYGFGCLFWQSAEADPDLLFATLARDDAGDPVLRLAAMSGTIQGLNNFLLADDPYERADIVAFCGAWAEAVEAPWMDAAGRQWGRIPQDVNSSILLGRCPAYDGYVDHVAGWVQSAEPGEQFMAESFFSQPGYVAFLATTMPDDWNAIVVRAPYPNPAFNRLLFLAYTEEVMRSKTLGPPGWATMVRTGLQMPIVDGTAMGRVLGSRSAGDWHAVWPDLKAHLMTLPGRPANTPWADTWPFTKVRNVAVCPGAGSEGEDDPEFLAAVDAVLASGWDSASPELRQTIVDWHLPRLLEADVPLMHWQSRADALQPWLLRSPDQTSSAAIQAALAGTPAP